MSHTSSPPQSAQFRHIGTLHGDITVPGDKSISHRALMLSALAVGESRISGLLEGEDVLATAAAMRAMGSHIERGSDGDWRVHGVGVGGLLQPTQALDMGNSGTSTRLLLGLLASHAITATFVGDASLSARPMGRVIEPLSRMGADIHATDGRLPLMLRGMAPAIPISYRLPVASAQVKSAIMLAALNTPGMCEIIEPVPTRDHSERMLAGFGANVVVELVNGVRHIRVAGEAQLRPQSLTVPGDPSSAAFFAVAASIIPGSNITIRNVGMNPTRSGIFKLLRAMGGDIVEENARIVGGEAVADLVVRHASLCAVEPDPADAPSMIDEFPVAFIAAALADGRSIFRGLDELRVKESDRISAMVAALKMMGAVAEELPDGIAITGSSGEILPGGGNIAGLLDHRICMASAIGGLMCHAPVTIDDMAPVATSFPTFAQILRKLHSDS
ncbi:MAG: 3-phosphoshikimate 1-carboxyvinyltransferase [Sphingomonadaceae bacterium]|nr:3-phosphoshikimate 1-carboxyvinyltransferase [Sphingomonadaceae bacterium]